MNKFSKANILEPVSFNDLVARIKRDYQAPNEVSALLTLQRMIDTRIEEARSLFMAYMKEIVAQAKNIEE